MHYLSLSAMYWRYLISICNNYILFVPQFQLKPVNKTILFKGLPLKIQPDIYFQPNSSLALWTIFISPTQFV